MADSESALTRAFLSERDILIFNQRRAGRSAIEIAKSFGISTRAVNAAINRQLSKMQNESVMAYPEVLRMELERLDSLMQAQWPLTQHRLIDINGEKFPQEPDQKATSAVLQIMAMRAKLLGLDRMTPQEGGTSGTGVQVVENIRSSIHGVTDEDSVAHDTKSDSIKFLRLAGETGVLDQATVDMMLARLTGDPEELPALEAPKEDDIADAEIVETPE